MITVNITINENRLQLKVKGHSGAAEVGQDIVCASASILAYTLAQHIKDMAEQRAFKTVPTIKLRRGYANICCEPKTETYNDALWGYHIIQKGMTLISHNYPQYVEMKTTIE